MFSGRYPPGTAQALAPYVYRYLDSHTVYLVSRPRGLPAGYTIEASATNHAESFRAEGGELGGAGGAAEDTESADADGIDLLGISMGGQIATTMAAREPDLVAAVEDAGYEASA